MKPIDFKWNFKIKSYLNGSMAKYKDKFTAQ